jgi:hypothetical protein
MNESVVAARPGKPPKVQRLNLAAKSLKVTLVLDPADLVGVTVPNVPQVPFAITVGGRVVKGRFNAKTLRRSAAVVAELGAERVAVLVSGRLGAGDEILDAGIAAQARAPRPAEAGNG